MAPSVDGSEDKRLSTVAALIGKAVATSYPAERHAMAMRAYSELAAFLAAIEDAPSAGRRRERRLYDRRTGSAPPGTGRTGATGDPGDKGPQDVPPVVIDLRPNRAGSLYRSSSPAPAPRGVTVDIGL